MHSLGTLRPSRAGLGPASHPGTNSSPAAAASRQRWQQCGIRPRHAVVQAAAGDKEGNESYVQLSPEEAAVYAALAAEKKAARQQSLQDAKRKRKFNPLHTNMKLTAAGPEDLKDQPPPAAAAAQGSAAPSSGSSSSKPAAVSPGGPSGAGAAFAARPRALPTALKQAVKQQQQQKQVDLPAAAPAAAAVSDSAALSAAVSALGLEGDFGAELAQLLAAEDIPEVSEIDPEQQQRPQRGFAGRPGGEPLATRARKSPAGIAKAAATKRAARRSVSERYLQSSAQALVKRAERDMVVDDEFEDVTDDDVIDAEATTLTQQQQQLQGGEAGPAAAAGADDDDDLDWQALAQYEELEKYIGDVKQQQQQQQQTQTPGRKPAAAGAANKVQVPAALSAAAAAEALKEEQQQAAAPAAPAAGQAPAPAAAAPGPAAAPAAPQGAAAAAAAAVAPTASSEAPAQQSNSNSSLLPSSPPQQQQQQQGPVKASGKKGSKSKRAKQVAMFEKDLDELERFVNMFESMQASSSSSSRQQLAQKPSLPGDSSSSSTAAAAADPEAAGEAFLAALLGQDWEAELLDDLAAVVDEGEEEQQQQQKQQQQKQQQQQGKQLGQPAPAGGSSAAISPAAAATAAADEGEEEDPWMDDITALLLGLVSISHQKYLGAQVPLPGLEAVTEEQRCGAFWSAPFGLLVLDDTAGNAVEYVNQGGAKALGRGYLDLFGQPAVDLVDQGLDSQADWAFAVCQVEESAAFSCQLPELRLVDSSGRQVVTSDVTLWRVDSLEDTPIGFAVMFKSWTYV